MIELGSTMCVVATRDDRAMAPNAVGQSEAPPLSVGAAARRLGVAPATLRTWDRRYGIGPSEHRAGQHRRYSAADLTRLETMRRLLMQGVGASDAARFVKEGADSSDAGPAGAEPEDAEPAVDRRLTPLDAATVRRLREAALRIDVEHAMDVLDGALRGRSVVDVWDGVIRPALVSLGDRLEPSAQCVAAEHMLSECVTRVLHERQRGGDAPAARPVLLVCAPDEAHVLPMHALAAALTEARVATRLVGASTPASALVEAARRTAAAAVVVWSQTSATADASVFGAIPGSRGGRLVVAAGPGWHGVDLPGRVERLNDLRRAVALLSDLTG